MRVIVVGGGEVGFAIARHLSEEKVDVVLIEQDEGRCARARDAMDISVLQGHGASPRMLKRAGIDNAGILIAVTNSDEVNLVACLIAAQLNPPVRRICRLRDMDYMDHIERLGCEGLGVDVVINLDFEAAKGMVDLMEVPTADSVRHFAGGKIRATGFQVQSGAPIVGMSLIDMAQKFDMTNVLVAAIERDGHVLIPRGGDHILNGDFLWMIVGEGRMDDVSGWIGRTPYRLKRVMIAGGTAVGFHLARLLEAKGIPVKLMEPDHKRAEVWAGMLNSTVVINGKGIDLGLLREENIGDVSAFVAATDLDEDNILSAMLATKEAVPKVIAMVERSEYAHVLSSIGVHAMISKNTQAVSVILGMLRRGKILSTALLGRDAEVIEYSALETSKVTSAPLKDLDFPKGALLACIVRDDQLIIPSGETHVQVGDHILVFTMKKSVKKVEKMMTVALGYF